MVQRHSHGLFEPILQCVPKHTATCLVAEVGKRRGEGGGKREIQPPAVAIGHHAKTFFIQTYVLQIIIYSFLENFKLISVVFRKFSVVFVSFRYLPQA